MEVYKTDLYWSIRSKHGPLPMELRGEWTSQKAADDALKAFQAKVRSKAKNVTALRRQREARYAAISG